MFESDDFDQVLSQFDLTEESTKNVQDKAIASLNTKGISIPFVSTEEIIVPSLQTREVVETQINNVVHINNNQDKIYPCTHKNNSLKEISNINLCQNTIVSPKHSKRKILNSHFDQKKIRKFPGPAGLLSGNLEDTKDDSISHLELSSQDIDYSQSIHKDLFESPLWKRLLEDIKVWNLSDVNTISSIKQQALAGNLRRKKAHIVVAFIEAIDRTVSDPLIILRDTSGRIKCTLHRDAWTMFSSYIVTEYCALVLWKPTVLTTGSAYKKHYLNITLSNIFAIFSSAVLKNETISLPEDYAFICEEDFTVIKSNRSLQSLESNENITVMNGDSSDILDDLDSVFADDLF